MSYLSIPSANKANEYVKENINKAINSTLYKFAIQIRNAISNSVSELVERPITDEVVKILLGKNYKISIIRQVGPGNNFDKVTVFW